MTTETNVPAQASDEPTAWSYECLQPHTTPGIWREFLSRDKPCEGPKVRNVQPLYATPRATADVELISDSKIIAIAAECGIWASVPVALAFARAILAATKGAKP